jgi:hypothetical protein
VSQKTFTAGSNSVEVQPGLKFAAVKHEIVLRQTPAGRYEIKATFLEDDCSIRTLTIQKYSSRTGPLDKQHFSFVGAEIDKLIGFVAGLKATPLDGLKRSICPMRSYGRSFSIKGRLAAFSRKTQNSSCGSHSRRTSRVMHTWRPEIITFDELLERARFIVEHTHETMTAADVTGGEISF